MKKMTSYERCWASLSEEGPDRAPVTGFELACVATLGGHKLKDTRFNPDLCAKLATEYMKKSGTDIYFGPIVETNGPFLQLGPEYVSQPEDNWMAVTKSYWDTPEEVDSKELYDPNNPKESEILRSTFLDKMAMGYKTKGDFLFMGVTWAPFTAASSIRGTETLLMDTLLEPALASKAIKKSNELFMEIYKKMIDNGLDWVMLGDPFASGTVLSNDTYTEFVAPSLKPAIDLFRSNKIPAMLHICGDSTPIVEGVKETNPEIFSMDFHIDIGYARQFFGNKFNLAGNVDPVGVLWQGTPQKVLDTSKACIEKAGKDGHFILAAACEMAKDAPLTNIQAMVEAVEKYGRY